MPELKRPEITFGTDGWRGIIAEDFTGASVRLVAQAVVNFLKRADTPGAPTIYVGYDNRSQSEYFAAEAAKVAAASGLRTILSSAACSSPAVSYNSYAGDARGAIMITASHNPPQFNGLKIKMGYGGSALPSMVTQIEQELSALLDAGVYAVDVPASAMDLVHKTDLRPAYFDGLRKVVDLDAIGASGYKIVVDSMHGSGAGYLPSILQQTNAQITEIRGDRNPVFGGVNPEPIPQNLGALRDAVLAAKADVGVAIDGDADRVGAMDSHGNFVDSHRIFAIALRHLYENKGLRGSVVKTVSTTRLIDKLCAKYGLELRVVPIGFKNICEWMLKEQVLIGGEESGGIGVLGHIPERDGPLMSLILLESMAVRHQRLEEQIDELMAEFGPHEYNRVDLHPNPARMPAIIRTLKEDNPTEIAGQQVASIDRTDGTKFDFADGSWLLLRASGTEPVVRVYSESSSQENVARLIEGGVQIVENA
ncbi:phosphoesterase [Capsulimonas corticalis]|uniref:Phosphoesterase n=1 Tax=Capsulimonas corticalis TaxID=2219043 RepID=A0A402CP11_9BACT|nr:phosphoglucomutase/phosphomannomutase family protein [Capsulimonas corticalis]BDI33171.1 phosphoesterase [Capsulimonas corticalis]